MQQRPDAEQLLLAIQGFLSRDLAPAIDDPALRFRALIAANLLAQITSELAARDDLDGAQRAGIVDVLGDGAKDHLGGPDELADLNAELARRIRVDALSDLAIQRTRAHLLETLGGAISVINPKFDLRREIE